MKKIDGVLDQLEAEAKSLKGKPTLGTITIGCALGYLDFRFGSHDWRAKRPKLAKWFTDLLQAAVDEGDGAAAGMRTGA